MLALGGCGGNECDNAYDKQAECWRGIDCTTLTDAMAKASCDSLKAAFDLVSGRESKVDCKDQFKDDAKAINSCTLQTTVAADATQQDLGAVCGCI